MIGKGIAALATEAASKKAAKVWAVEHDLLDVYTADGYTIALEQLIKKAQPTLGVVSAYLSDARLRAQARDAIRRCW